MTNNNSVWTVQLPTEEPKYETSERTEYNNHLQTGEVHAAELNAIELQSTLTWPNVVSRDLLEMSLRLGVICEERQRYAGKSSPMI